MKDFKYFLNEAEEKITYSQEHVASYSGQDNYEIGIYFI